MKFQLTSVIDAQYISEFYLKNQDHLNKWEPLREEGYHSSGSWLARLREREKEQIEGRSAYFVSYKRSDEIIAICNLTNIVKGPFQACNIGYAVSHPYQGKGIMRELCEYVISYAFNQLELNRVMANYMPINHRSESLLKRLGFSKEGFAKNYLKINGRWEDHILTSLLNQANL